MIRTMGSLFAGIGGFDLGFERAGFEIAWQVEIDPYCRKVLERHFPHAQRFSDVRECGAHNLKPVDVLCGGFPCQDISNAGKRAGIEGESSGLWSEYARIIGELRPRFVVVENVAALLGRGMGRVLGDLAEIGYDADWEIVSAADVGAPHLRERVWILAYPMQRSGRSELGQQQEEWSEVSGSSGAGAMAHTEGRTQRPGFCSDQQEGERGGRPGDGSSEMGHAIEPGLEGFAGNGTNGEGRSQQDGSTGAAGICRDAADAEGERCSAGQSEQPLQTADAYILPAIRAAIARGECGEWESEPDVGRLAHGIPARVDRLKALGNAVVPQIPELIARRILETL